MNLYNLQTGNLEIVENPMKAYLDGTHGFRAGTLIPMANPKSRAYYEVPVENLETEIRKGSIFAPDSLQEEVKAQEKYGEGAKTKTRAFLEGMGRGASVGLFDKIAIEAFGADPKGLRERKKRSKGLATLGELSTIVAPIMVGVGAPSALMSGVAKRQGQKFLAKEILGKGALNKVAARSIPGVMEGAYYGLEDWTSEAALGNTEATAENAIAHVTLGGAFGGALNLGTMAAAKSMKHTLNPMAQKAANKFNTAFSKDAVQKVANQRGLAAVSTAKSFWDKADRLKGGQSGVAKTLFDQKVLRAGSRNTMEEINSRSFDLYRKAGEQIGKLAEEGDRWIATHPGRVALKSVDDILSEVENKVVLPLMQKGTRTAKRAGLKLRGEIGGFRGKYGGSIPKDPSKTLLDSKGMPIIAPAEGAMKTRPMTLVEKREMRGVVGDLANWENRNVKDFNEAAKATARIMEDTVEKEMDQVVKKAGLLKKDLTAFGPAESYEEAKLIYHHMKLITRFTKEAIDKEPRLRKFGLTDYMAGSAIGLGSNSYAVGALGALVNRFTRKNADAFIAVQANKLANSKLYNKWNMEREKKIGSAVGNFLTKKAPKAALPVATTVLMDHSLLGDDKEKPANMQEAFKERKKELDHLGENVDTTLAYLSSSTKELGDMPDLASQINYVQAKGLKFLDEKLPKNPGGDVEIGKEGQSYPSDAAIAKWARYFKGVTSPWSVIEDFENGTLTMEGVEVLREVYPKMYKDFALELIEQIVEKDSKLSYEQKISISNILQIPVMQILTPQYLNMLQMNFKELAMPEPPGPERSPARAKGLDKISQSEAVKTSTQSALTGPVGGA